MWVWRGGGDGRKKEKKPKKERKRETVRDDCAKRGLEGIEKVWVSEWGMEKMGWWVRTLDFEWMLSAIKYIDPPPFSLPPPKKVPVYS